MRDAKNNIRAALNEKSPSDRYNNEYNMKVATQVLVMRNRMQVLLLMISNVSYCEK